MVLPEASPEASLEASPEASPVATLEASPVATTETTETTMVLIDSINCQTKVTVTCLGFIIGLLIVIIFILGGGFHGRR